MQMQKPNKPVFSKGSSAQTPPHSALMFPTVTLMWKKWLKTSEIIMAASTYPQLSPHRNPELTNLCAAYFVFTTESTYKIHSCIDLEKVGAGPISLSHSPWAVWVAYIWKLLSDISGGQVLIPACEDCVNLRPSLPPFNTLWFGSTWLADNTEQVVVKGLPSPCLFLILFVSFVYH